MKFLNLPELLVSTFNFPCMLQRVQWLFLLFSLAICCPVLRAQHTITTQALSTSSICPGSTIDVQFTRTGEFNLNSYSVQLSDGSDYKTIATGSAQFDSKRGTFTIPATIPANQAAGTTYSIRITASSPAVIGTPSATKLTIKTKPNAPTVDAVQLDCQRQTANDAFTNIYLRILSGAKAKIYDRNLNLIQDGNTLSISDPTNIYFQFSKGVAPSDNPYRYPVSETTYYLSQVVDGCESDKTQTVSRILYRPNSGPSPVNQFAAGFGRLTYCQGDKAVALNVNGHSSPPENYQTLYTLQDANLISTTIPPIPDTSVPNSKTYRLSLSPIDSNKGCPSPTLAPGPFLKVDVNPRPGKPTVPTNTISLCQFQQASSLSASVTASDASLVWYGTNATGGTGSTVALTPSTANAGTFKYYVAQKLNDCESERAEITVDVKTASPAPTVSPVSYCQGTPASQLSAIAASGGTLNWYTSVSGGTGSPAVPTPSTTNIGTTNYYVSQTVSGSCESQRIVLPVIVNSIPPAPGVGNSNVSLCQNAPAQPLAATGQNLKWYDVASGGNSSLPITPNTAIVGTKIYYVSQTINNCEGPRTAINVTVKEAPATPTVPQTEYAFCQNSNGRITFNVNAPIGIFTWISSTPGGGVFDGRFEGNSVTASVKTTTPGRYEYWGKIKGLNECESQESQHLFVTVKATPSAPNTSPTSVCQNGNALTLAAGGQNLKWYSSDTTKTALPSAPTINTSQPTASTYFVSQTVDGCEGPRVSLTATIKQLPGVPTVANTGPTYCQNTQAAPLAATGQELKWYRESSGGTSVGNSFTPDTKEAGNFTYYVSQTIDGCEGSRSSVTVKVTPQPTLPSVTNAYSYCQNVSAPALTASGTALKWYDSSGKSSDTAPLPSTNAPGTVSYFVTQTVEQCESQRAEIKITTKQTPGAPGTSAISICQNESTRALSANGQNLKWYTASTGGDGMTAVPTINTSQTGQTNYYVSQTLDGCEGPRSVLSVTVKPQPAAPTVTQKNICQFTTPESVSATGQNLKWYNTDNMGLPSAPMPITDKGATFMYQVTQTVDGCESPKIALMVTILTTPVPTVSKTTVELCLGAASQPLEASGTNLRWTDPNGMVTTAIPTPPTVNATIKPEGDVYYVTQSLNGCESPKVAIKVFVQTPPTMSILGTTTTNLGLEVPLRLIFTGVGPYRFKLSNGLSGTALKDTTVLVLPTSTTIYQVAEVTNKCGTGLPGNGATATVTVMIPGIQTLALTTTTVCAGTSLSTNFLITGTFNPGSVFKVQLAKTETDSSKINFVDMLAMQAQNGQIVGTIPGNTPAGTYWVRVMATNPKIPINGNISPTLLIVRSLPTAILTGTQNIYESQPASLTLAFTGDGPWTFAYRDSTATGPGTSLTATATANPYVLEVRPTKTTAYLLTSVSNGCGTGTRIGSPALVTVAPLLGVDDGLLADAVEVYPIPATTTLTVQIKGLSATQPALLELTDLTGRTTLRQQVRQATSSLLLDQQPSGVYLLRIRVGERTATKRVVKL